LGFDSIRAEKLHSFVKYAISSKWRYNIFGIFLRFNFNGQHARKRDQHSVDIIEILERPMKVGTLLPWNSWLNRASHKVEAYWCSEFVARCYFEVGIFTGLMDRVEPPNLILPSDLACNDNFGWVVGVLATDKYIVPHDDKCFQGTNHWEVCAAKRCKKCPF
jgi:hypothetical protein